MDLDSNNSSSNFHLTLFLRLSECYFSRVSAQPSVGGPRVWQVRRGVSGRTDMPSGKCKCSERIQGQTAYHTSPASWLMIVVERRLRLRLVTSAAACLYTSIVLLHRLFHTTSLLSIICAFAKESSRRCFNLKTHLSNPFTERCQFR